MAVEMAVPETRNAKVVKTIITCKGGSLVSTFLTDFLRSAEQKTCSSSLIHHILDLDTKEEDRCLIVLMIFGKDWERAARATICPW